jgi:hypothetical protein
MQQDPYLLQEVMRSAGHCRAPSDDLLHMLACHLRNKPVRNDFIAN